MKHLQLGQWEWRDFPGEFDSVSLRSLHLESLKEVDAE